jgi:hypothetical protein
MDSASSAVATASLGIRTCEGLLSVFDSWKTTTSPVNKTDLYDSVADLSKVLVLLVELLRLAHDLDQEKSQCVSACLSGCDIAFLELAETLEDLRRQTDASKGSQAYRVGFWMDVARMMTIHSTLASILADIRARLEPAMYILKPNKTDTNIATTSGFDKGKRNRFRRSLKHSTRYASIPAIDPVKTLPCAEEGELADAARETDSKPHREHHEPKPYTPRTGGQQLAYDSTATLRTAFWQRVPFCYLLAALGLVFISSSSAVGIYYSIAKNAMGDGFTTAGYMLAVGTLVVTPPAAYHYQHCRCWKSGRDNVRLRGTV